MNPYTTPVSLNESSLQINLLHQVLKALGFPVSPAEVNTYTAGDNTLAQVRNLLARLGIDLPAEAVMDEVTFEALSQEMQRRGMLNRDHSFVLNGTVSQANGEPARRQQLIALDIDLRGAAIYRTVTSLQDIQRQGGFEYLSQGLTDAQGDYEFSFYSFQYAVAERKKADVVVFAIDERGQVLGRSRLVNSEDYSAAKSVQNLNIQFSQRAEKTEYDLLLSKLQPFLRESQLEIIDLAKSVDQIQFTANELDESFLKIKLIVIAENLGQDRLTGINLEDNSRLFYELLYGIGRQNIELDWAVLYQKTTVELKAAIEGSTEENIIKAYEERLVEKVLKLIQQGAANYILKHKNDAEAVPLEKLLSIALPHKKQQSAFVHAYREFQTLSVSGEVIDYEKFWKEYLPNAREFRNKPELISHLLLSQQLDVLTGKHYPLMRELQENAAISSLEELLDFEPEKWKTLIARTGVPAFIDGENEEERISTYAHHVQTLLHAEYPTQKIALMLEREELPIDDLNIANGIRDFLQQQSDFDIRNSRVQDFAREIEAVSPRHGPAVSTELKRLQRVFQVSPSPEVVPVLMQKKLNSAYQISSISRKHFVQQYGDALGGSTMAEAVHQRAEHIHTTAAERYMKLHELIQAGNAPHHLVAEADYIVLQETLSNELPNYANLVGSPDRCECDHCSSVYSAAAYFIELLRFLWRGKANGAEETPLDKFAERRPDLLHLPLSCENTNTLIPYIDLVNEVLEYYTYHGALDGQAVQDTGSTTADELRANPQYFELEAYRVLKEEVYPFSLPYYQPLDVIRTYGRHLKTARHEVMKVLQNDFSARSVLAIQAETLEIAEEEFIAMTGVSFDGLNDTKELHEYFGYNTAADLEKLAGTKEIGISEFLRRSGLKYTELVELVRTQFINPHQQLLDFLETLFIDSTLSGSDIYARLSAINDGTLSPSTDPAIMDVLADEISPADFTNWVQSHFEQFNEVITLFQPTSACELKSTFLRSLGSLYGNADLSGIGHESWSKMHRFLRLWRKLGWNIQELDLMLAALGEKDITKDTIVKISDVVLLQQQLKLPLEKMATLWGNINMYGKKPLYKKLFLNKAVQKIDTTFQADKFGHYLTDTTQVLQDHISAILAAFRISEEDLNTIVEVVLINDNGTMRPLQLASDPLNIFNLSLLYRYVVLSKALKLKTSDCALLIQLFEANPFSTLALPSPASPFDEPVYENIAPSATLAFYTLSTDIKKSGFKASALQYIFAGNLPPTSTLSLQKEKVLQALKVLRTSFNTIEQNHPTPIEEPITADILQSKLALTFQADKVNQLIAIIDGTAVFSTITDTNLQLDIPDKLTGKYQYTRASGRFNCIGIMTDDERSILKSVPGINASFENAIDGIYQMPEVFIKTHFSSLFDDINAAIGILLHYPAQDKDPNLEEKLELIYHHYLPLLKQQRYQEEVVQQLAFLLGLSQEATRILTEKDLQHLIESITPEGFSADYFANASFSAPPAKVTTDKTINFDWNITVPDASIPADNFSVRWQTYLAPPSSADYTLVVETRQADEAFKLYIDEVLVLQKEAGNAITSWEVIAPLNAAKLHKIALEYVEDVDQAGISLSWKKAISGLDIIASNFLFPAHAVKQFIDLAQLYHRAAQLISTFQLSEKEIQHFINYPQDFDQLDFKALNPTVWQRIHDYVSLRNTVPQSQAQLTTVFAAANISTPAPSLSDLIAILHLATAWDLHSISYLSTTHFSLTVDDFKNEIALMKIKEAMSLVFKTGLAPETIAQWAAPVTDFDQLHATAEIVKRATKAKYEEADWLKLAGNLSDAIRKNQRQALISHLLTKPELIDWGATDADGLFEYFLIDVQMGTCMDTSRIVQANAAVQMFVNRCLLNLESAKASGEELGVSPDAIDKERWEWMKNYRVWEVNRKIFLYPENWLRPEWRDDRSPFFKELESELTQNDITDRSVETALRNYVNKLDAVSNLDISGMYQENYDGNRKMKTIHVVGRTHNAPYQFFYRSCNEFYKWNAWEKVGVDIRMTEDGDNSGVHLIPVVWKNRLLLFWPEFMEKQREKTDSLNKTTRKKADEPVANLKADSYYEIRLAWSEYTEGTWSPKQLSNQYVEVQKSSVKYFRLQVDDFSDIAGNLRIFVSYFGEPLGRFTLSSINSPVQASLIDYQGTGTVEEQSEKQLELNGTNFMKYQSSNLQEFPSSEKLSWGGITYLNNKVQFNLLNSSNRDSRKIDVPFFYTANSRTYFTKPLGYKIGLHTPNAYTLNTFFKNNTYFNISSINSWGLQYTPAYNQSSKRLEFNTFHHPFSGQFINTLNAEGLKSLLAMDTALNDDKQLLYNDDGTNFVEDYDPNFAQDLVKKAPISSNYKPNQAYTYYKENICFDVFGANSIYNWEVFFHAPLYIATQLSKNGRYEEAMKWFHFIFDPTTDDLPLADQEETARYWKFLPFKTTAKVALEDWFKALKANDDPGAEEVTIAEWRESPFKPFVVARNRPLTFMKNVVLNYVDNLRLWGDSLFRQFTRESINEALQLYVIANHILGPRPEWVPKRGQKKTETYDSLKGKWDDFSNALVDLENIFPYSSSVPISKSSPPPSLLGVGSALYFCIPENDKLLEYWDTVADRLFKIRHCMDIDGVERQLALFAPPIDPALLINAVAQGLSLGSILADISSPPPIYRFSFLLQKANEFCSEVKGLGSALLAALEKKDNEEIGRLRAAHETGMQELITAIRERQVLDAKVNKEALLKSRETAAFKFAHYNALLSDEAIQLPDPPELETNLNAESQLPADTTIPIIEVDADDALVDSGDNGIKIITREKQELELNEKAMLLTYVGGALEGLAASLRLIPQFEAAAKPLGVGSGFGFGGVQLGGIASSLASGNRSLAAISTAKAAAAQKMASYIRREQDWTLQANLAAKEIIQLDKQITSADIQIQVAEKELSNHQQRIKNAQQVEHFLSVQGKFTNQELYQWMKEQLISVYKQSFNLAYELAKKAEKCYQHELGKPVTSFIQYGYWDNTKQGLVAGEKLQLALRQLERSYIEENKRELELSKSISLALLNPLALQELKSTGKCFLSIPEEWYDLDYQGHYFRRIKSMSISIPGIVGPYTTLNCTVRLLKNSLRINTSMNDAGAYEHNHDEGIWIDDDRFRSSNVAVKAIATSTGQRDAGLFELNFRDERYLPFERAGAISEWKIELTQDIDLRQFDYSTISDVILHINYTAREDAGLFREKVVAYLKDFLTNAAELSTQPLMRMFSIRHEFSTDWHKFLHPTGGEDADQTLNINLDKDHFPFFTKERSVLASKVEVLLQASRTGDYMMVFTGTDQSGEAMNSTEISMPEDASLANMQRASLSGITSNVNIEDMDVFAPISLKFRHSSDVSVPQQYNQIDTKPMEFSDLFIVFHYALGG